MISRFRDGDLSKGVYRHVPLIPDMVATIEPKTKTKITPSRFAHTFNAKNRQNPLFLVICREFIVSGTVVRVFAARLTRVTTVCPQLSPKPGRKRDALVVHTL